MNGVQIINGIECFIDTNGIVQLNLENVSRGLGFVDNSKKTEYIRWNRVDGYLNDAGMQFATSGERPKHIPEPIFYLLAMKAESDTAKEFQKKVAYEVLPSIRKHGMYATDELLDNPDLLIQVATALKEERIKTKQLETEVKVKDQQISELQPKATYYDLVLQCPTLISMTEISKDYGKSASWMNKKLHELGVQFCQSGIWFLYQKYSEYGYTKTKTHNYADSSGEQQSKTHMYWTQKGRLFIYETLKDIGLVPLIEREVD